jgi:hypothetical protein
MNNPLPAHLAAAIRERIGVLRETSRLDEVHASSDPRPPDHAAPGRQPGHRQRPGDATATFPGPHSDDVRRWLTGFLSQHGDDARSWSPPRQDRQFRAQNAGELQF